MFSMSVRRLCRALAVAVWAVPALAAGDEAIEVQRLMRQGDLQAALQRASTAASAQPTHAAARFLQGVILTDLLRDAEALDVFERLTQEFPALPEPYNNIALLHARAGRWEQALTALQAALRNDPTHRIARENLGDVHVQLALQAWNTAASGSVAGATLQRKLRLGRELAHGPLPAAVVGGTNR